MKKITAILVMVQIVTALTAQNAASQVPIGDIDDPALILYVRGTELVLKERINEAVAVFELLLKEYPESPYAGLVREFYDKHAGTLDRSAIVSFYIGNLATATYISFMIPNVLFDTTDEIITGISGITGIGLGLGSAWLMSRNTNMGLGQDLWIETVQALSMANYELAFQWLRTDLWPSMEEQVDTFKWNHGGLIATAVTSRGLAYAAVRDASPSPGRAAMVLNTYGWAHFYYWLSALGILEMEDPGWKFGLGLLIPDLAAAGSYLAWDYLNWSSLRSGLVTVGGVGGGLLGVFTTILMENVDVDSRIKVAIMMGGAAAGQAAAAYWTSGMDAEEPAEAPLLQQLHLFPLASDKGVGIGGTVRF